MKLLLALLLGGCATLPDYPTDYECTPDDAYINSCGDSDYEETV